MSRNGCVLTVCVFDPAGLEWKMTQLFTPLQVMHGPILVMLARFNSNVKLINILSKYYIFKQNHFINYYYFTLDSSDVSVTIVRHGYVAARFHLLWPTNFHARCSGTTDPDRADASSGARLNFEHSRAVWRHTSGEHTCPTGAESGHDSSWRCQPRVGSPEAVSISDRSEWDPGKDSPNGSSPSSQLQRSRVWHLTDLLWQWMTAMTCLQLGPFHDAKMSWWDISWKCLTSLSWSGTFPWCKGVMIKFVCRNISNWDMFMARRHRITVLSQWMKKRVAWRAIESSSHCWNMLLDRWHIDDMSFDLFLDSEGSDDIFLDSNDMTYSQSQPERSEWI